MVRKSFTTLIMVSALAGPAFAAECHINDRACIVNSLHAAADTIDNVAWRDQTYRELAKTLAFDGYTDEAIAVIPKIQNADTKAMTIRGIGMTVADNKVPKKEADIIFQKLRTAAEQITDKPSYAIALTYIAMSQAFAGDNEGAWKTASEMENEALRHKAYGETAEIQADNGDWGSAQKSIGFITSAAYKNKAYETVAKILADGNYLEEALMAAQSITNPYKKAEALQYVLDKQKPREVPHSKLEDTGTDN